MNLRFPIKFYRYGRKRQSYDNCKLQAPNGDMLSTCDKKKADWYVKKGLAGLTCL